MIWLVIVLFVVCFGSILLVVGFASKYFKAKQKEQIRSMLRKAEEAPTSRSAHLVDLLKPSGADDRLAKFLSNFAFISKLDLVIEQSGQNSNSTKLLITCLIAGAVGFAFGQRFSFILSRETTALCIGALTSVLPFMNMLRLRKKRFAQFEQQLPEALDFISRSMRAGHGFTIALEMLAADSPDPLGGAFRKIANDMQLGGSLQACFTRLLELFPLVDVRFFASSVVLQQETGGNLGEILSKLATIIRERFRLKGQVKAAERTRANHGNGTGSYADCRGLFHDDDLAGLFDRDGKRQDGPNHDLRRRDRPDHWLFRHQKNHQHKGLIMPIIFAVALFAGLLAVTGGFGYYYYERPSRLLDQLTNTTRTRTPLLEKKQTSFNFSQLLKQIGDLLPVSPQDAKEIKRDMIAAGVRSENAVQKFYGIKIIFSVVCLVGAIIGRGHIKDGFPKTILPIAGAGIGFLLPGMILNKMIDKRNETIRLALPDVLDLLVVCTEAGCGLDQAIVNVSRELKTVHPAMSDELAIVNMEIMAGTSRADALRHLAKRCAEDEIKKLVALLVQTDRFGTSISDSLRTQSDYLRIRRRQEAEERAGKVGVKLVFPIFFFCLPSLLVVTAGPGVLTLIHDLASLNANR